MVKASATILRVGLPNLKSPETYSKVEASLTIEMEVNKGGVARVANKASLMVRFIDGSWRESKLRNVSEAPTCFLYEIGTTLK